MEKQIRILHAITRLDKGGSSENTLLSVIGLARKGYAVDLLFGYTENPYEDLVERAKKAGVRFISQKDLVRNIHPVRDIMAFFKILNFMRRNRYDIMHAHSHKAGFICRVAARCAGIEKIVFTPHGHVFYGYFGRILTDLILSAERMAARITDKIIGLTGAECYEWLCYEIGNEDIYTVIPSGIEFENLEREVTSGVDWKKELGIPPEKVLIGSIGRFIEIKGYEYFIEAAVKQLEKKRDIYFLLAGDGPFRGKYLKMLTAANITDRFHIIPWQENTGAVLNALDIFVLPSLNEGMGRTLVGAMFLGKPVIATRVGGVSSLVFDNAGILIESASSDAVSKALDELLDNTEEARHMGEKERKKALADYSAEKMVDALDALYRELLGTK